MSMGTPDERRSRLRSWFGSTGVAPQTTLLTYIVCGAIGGAALGFVLDPAKGAFLSGLTGAIIAAAGSRGPSRIALRVAGFTAVIAQIVLMRELIVVFYGNEISLGLMLASWLLWTAAPTRRA